MIEILTHKRDSGYTNFKLALDYNIFKNLQVRHRVDIRINDRRCLCLLKILSKVM
jgi:hypothetical protein